MPIVRAFAGFALERLAGVGYDPIMEKNEIRLDFTGNPKLKEALTGQKEGDTAEIEITVQWSEITPAFARGQITSIGVEANDSAAPAEPSEESGGMGGMMGESEDVTPSAEEPIAVSVMRKATA